MNVNVSVEELPIDVTFFVIEDETVNAIASRDKILVTKGLLNFSKSNEELAAVMAHELAHIVRGHYKRKLGGVIAKSVTAISLGITAEVFAPGSGQLVINAAEGVGGLFSLKFSRDLEREADFYSLKFLNEAGYDIDSATHFQERFAIEIPKSLVSGYLSTHPSSPERKLRLEKAVAKIKGGVKE